MWIASTNSWFVMDSQTCAGPFLKGDGIADCLLLHCVNSGNDIGTSFLPS